MVYVMKTTVTFLKPKPTLQAPGFTVLIQRTSYHRGLVTTEG